MNRFTLLTSLPSCYIISVFYINFSSWFIKNQRIYFCTIDYFTFSQIIFTPLVNPGQHLMAIADRINTSQASFYLSFRQTLLCYLSLLVLVFPKYCIRFLTAESVTVSFQAIKEVVSIFESFLICEAAAEVSKQFLSHCFHMNVNAYDA